MAPTCRRVGRTGRASAVGGRDQEDDDDLYRPGPTRRVAPPPRSGPRAISAPRSSGSRMRTCMPRTSTTPSSRGTATIWPRPAPRSTSRSATSRWSRACSSNSPMSSTRLNKFEQGTYGICDNCGKEISLERLQAIPQAALCIDCKSPQDGRLQEARRLMTQPRAAASPRGPAPARPTCCSLAVAARVLADQASKALGAAALSVLRLSRQSCHHRRLALAHLYLQSAARRSASWPTRRCCSC